MPSKRTAEEEKVVGGGGGVGWLAGGAGACAVVCVGLGAGDSVGGLAVDCAQAVEQSSAETNTTLGLTLKAGMFPLEIGIRHGTECRGHDGVELLTPRVIRTNPRLTVLRNGGERQSKICIECIGARATEP